MSARRRAVRLRAMAPEDLDAVLDLERATAEAPHWSASVYRDAVPGAAGKGGQASATERRVVVAVMADKDSEREVLAGFAGGQVVWPATPGRAAPSRGQAVGELETIVVAVEVRRRGVGRALCDAMLAWMREAGAETVELEVRASSAAAITLYGSLGFAEQGRRRGYYAHPVEDAILMAMPLDKALSR